MSTRVDIPVLETERLRLRGWREEDHAPFARFCASEATARFVGGVCGPDDAWRRIADAHGHGYATEAARRGRDYAYRELGWRTLVSCIAPANAPSQRVAARLGAACERTIELRGFPVGLYRHPDPEALHS
jgi:RimJ/RimL family protein N-acetyltransferase